MQKKSRNVLPFPFSSNNGHDRVVSSKISRTSRCCRPARSASAIPSATPATATPIISCKTRFILDALPTSPIMMQRKKKKNKQTLLDVQSHKNRKYESLPRKNEFLPMAWKHDWQSSNRVLSPAARMTSIPSSACTLLP